MKFLALTAGLGLWVLPVVADTPGLTAWNASCQYTYQGSFVSGQVKGIDCNVATVAFPGHSQNPIHPFGECVYIDNSTPKSYFIPLKSQNEWQAFKQHLPKGVSLRGC